MVDQVGVQWVVGGDHDHQAALTAASGTSCLLPETGDRAGETTGHHRIQAADVDAQLQCAGGGQAQQVAIVQALFQFPAGLRGVARAVGRDACGVVGTSGRREVLGAGQGGDLGTAAGAYEGQCAGSLTDQPGHDPGGLGGRGPAYRRAVLSDPALDEAGFPQCDGALALRGTIGGHRGDDASGESGGVPGRVGGGGAGEDHGGTGPGLLGQAQQATQYQGDMCAEHAPVDVAFVDDDELQGAQQARPAGGLSEDRGVHHVRVGDDDARLVADRAAGLRWGVAVIGGDHDVAQSGHRRAQPCQGADLVLGQRLCGREVEAGRGGRGCGGGSAADGGGDGSAGGSAGGRVALGGEVGEDRELVSEGLPGGCAGGHHHVTTGPGVLGGGYLVAPGCGDPGVDEVVAQVRVDPVWPGHRLCVTGGLGAGVGQWGGIVRRCRCQCRRRGICCCSRFRYGRDKDVQ